MLNAQAAYRGFIERTGQQIENTVSRGVSERSFRGTFNNEADNESIIYAHDRAGNKYIVTNGKIETDANGNITNDDMVLVRNADNGQVVRTSIRANELTIDSRTPKEEWRDTFRTEVQELWSKKLVEEGVAKDPEAEAEQTTGQPTEVQPQTEQPKEETKAEPKQPGAEQPKQGEIKAEETAVQPQTEAVENERNGNEEPTEGVSSEPQAEESYADRLMADAAQSYKEAKQNIYDTFGKQADRAMEVLRSSKTEEEAEKELVHWYSLHKEEKSKAIRDYFDAIDGYNDTKALIERARSGQSLLDESNSSRLLADAEQAYRAAEQKIYEVFGKQGDRAMEVLKSSKTDREAESKLVRWNDLNGLEKSLAIIDYFGAIKRYDIAKVYLEMARSKQPQPVEKRVEPTEEAPKQPQPAEQPTTEAGQPKPDNAPETEAPKPESAPKKTFKYGMWEFEIVKENEDGSIVYKNKAGEDVTLSKKKFEILQMSPEEWQKDQDAHNYADDNGVSKKEAKRATWFSTSEMLREEGKRRDRDDFVLCDFDNGIYREANERDDGQILMKTPNGGDFVPERVYISPVYNEETGEIHFKYYVEGKIYPFEMAKIRTVRYSLDSLTYAKPKVEAKPTIEHDPSVGKNVTDKWDNAERIKGDEDEIGLPNGEDAVGHYELMESSVATPSHNALNGFRQNEGVPTAKNGATRNDRDYEHNKKYQEDTRNMSMSYDKRAVQSPVIVTRDGIVISGNGRTMAGELAAANNTDANYIDYLKRHAKRYGFTEEQVEKMKHPRLVFVLDEKVPYTTEEYAKYNGTDQKQANDTERAKSVGKVLAEKKELVGRINATLAEYDDFSSFYNSKDVDAIVTDLVKEGVINELDLGWMYENDKISDRGKKFFESLLIGSVFTNDADSATIDKIVAHANTRQMIVKALKALTEHKRIASMKNGSDYSLLDELRQAISIVHDGLTKGGYKVGQRVSQEARAVEMFGEKEYITDDANILMLADILNDTHSTLFKRFLEDYNSLTEQYAAGQTAMFLSDGEAMPTKDEIIKEYRKAKGYEYRGTRQDSDTQVHVDTGSVQKSAKESTGGRGESPAGTSANAATEGGGIRTRTVDEPKPFHIDDKKEYAEAMHAIVNNGFEDKFGSGYAFTDKKVYFYDVNSKGEEIITRVEDIDNYPIQEYGNKENDFKADNRRLRQSRGGVPIRNDDSRNSKEIPTEGTRNRTVGEELDTRNNAAEILSTGRGSGRNNASRIAQLHEAAEAHAYNVAK